MRLRRAVLSLALALVAFLPISGGAAGPAWEQWRSVPGVFDLGGPLASGSLLVAGSAAFYTLTPAGDLTPFARGAGGYSDDPGAEAYFAVSPGQHNASAGCDFVRDDAFVLRLHVPIGITRVGRSGDETGSFTNLNVAVLNGIAFDNVGSFDHRLLVTAPVNGKTELLAVDCTGAVQVITKTAPIVEGGISVAPTAFGSFGGYLIAPDELSGTIWAFSPEGTTSKLVDSGLPKGMDIGVESIAFVPPGFSRGGYAYYSDRKTPGNPHPGTDSVLRMSSADLTAAGIQDGDLLAVTEGGATTIDVRCDSSCHATTVVSMPTSAHGEGHLVFTMNPPPKPSRSPTAIPIGQARPVSVAPLIAIAAAVLAAGTAVMFALAARRRPR